LWRELYGLTKNYFEIFNLPAKFDVDLVALQKNYREIQKKIHPDKFTTSTENEKIQSMIKSTEINDAYKTLKLPIKRASYLTSLHASDKKIILPPEFLMQQMEWEEYFESIQTKKGKIHEFDSLINNKKNDLIELLQNQIDQKKDWDAAAITIHKLQFVEQLINKISQQLLK
jgi:molecular chaperone HscB